MFGLFEPGTLNLRVCENLPSSEHFQRNRLFQTVQRADSWLPLKYSEVTVINKKLFTEALFVEKENPTDFLSSKIVSEPRT